MTKRFETIEIEIGAGVAADSLQQAVDRKDWDRVAEIRKQAFIESTRPIKEAAERKAAELFNNAFGTPGLTGEACDKAARGADDDGNGFDAKPPSDKHHRLCAWMQFEGNSGNPRALCDCGYVKRAEGRLERIAANVYNNANPPTPREKAAFRALSAGFSNSYLKPEHDLQKYAIHVMEDVNAALHEARQDNVVVDLPDTDRAFVEILDFTTAASDPDGPEVLRLRALTFRPGPTPEGAPAMPFATPKEAADALSEGLCEYIKSAIRAQRTSDQRLFVCWRRRPEIKPIDDEGVRKWTGFARFVAQWADKKFAPEAGPFYSLGLADIVSGRSNLATADTELTEANLLRALEQIREVTAARRDVQKITGIEDLGRIAYEPALPSWVNDLPPMLRLFLGDAKPGTDTWRDRVKLIISEQKRYEAEPPADTSAGEAIGAALAVERDLDYDRGTVKHVLTMPGHHVKLPLTS